VHAPGGSAGTVDVTATTAGGTSATSAADHYTYVAPLKTVTVTKSGAGAGTVISAVPSGINCGSVCSAEFAASAPVTLEATPNTGSVFIEWTGCTSVLGTTCFVEGSTNRTVGAVFGVAQYSLTVTTAGSGGGSVSCDGGACAGSYPYGTVVTLSATPDPSSTFSGWSGGGCSGTGACSMTISADTAVTATFDKKPEPTPPPASTPPPPAKEGTAKAPAGSASVSGNKAQIKLSCSGAGACEGVLKLYAKVKQGKKHKTVVIGKSSFKVAAGKSKTIKVKITNQQIEKQLRKGHTVKVQLKGSGLKNRTIKLKPKKKGKNKAAGRVERRRVGHHR
jgi:hypothetical protein